ncbi:zinc finger SWIM domain-containing protein 1 [Alligator sinensis]|uniref:Zinc finger SWIM domain-containing protein 1 n=1 Tax=Alligator sinensis TaxID=38654 RepID=A0A3Q0FJJ0_ALLSI|nr:zinc finger SWIM domain-containing protein 1 [Alligator sinensis]XP_025047776.1 zinc finger SWIM domain-containing protein 1 [Alligator sinensis]XP_025047777.1 zinc finger SWIM domain-containing protein 1 [Alligator sinensis]XP_025047778.1 zinc finger SWIM domain-containing protein 1 [Alligator sinensis]
MALETVRELLSFDCGSLVAYQLDKSSQLDAISFQTVLMRDVFVRFPEVVLIHRTHSGKGKALYMFMVDKPFLKLEGEMMKVIHFAVPAKESAESLSRLYKTFKAFNPEWKKIQTFLVDPHFPLLPILSQAFPSAEVQLSVFHVCKYLQHKIHQLSLECYTERLILNTLRNTMCAATESNLRKMHTVLSDFVKPDLLPQLHIHWLLNSKIWVMHSWRNWAESSEYFKDLEITTRGLSQVFCTGRSLETCATSLAKHYQKCVSERPPDAVLVSTTPSSNHMSAEAAPQSVPAQTLRPASTHPSTSLCNQPAQKTALVSLNHGSLATLQNPLIFLQNPLAAPQISQLLQNHSTNAWSPLKLPLHGTARETIAEDTDGDHDTERSREADDRISQSLQDICTAPATKLCLTEFAVVQKSVQLIGTNEDAINVQILEDAHKVDPKGLKSCTCPLNQTFRLPCRHVLAVLNSDRRVSQPEMLSKQWQKGPGGCQAGPESTNGFSEVLNSSWEKSLDKSLVVSFLTKEISRLLTQCSSEEFDRRYNTLRELADSWIGPYVEVKL